MNYNPSGPSKPEPTRESQVREQMNRLEKEILRAADVRDQMEDRISAILRPGEPSSGERIGNDKAQIAPLAQELERLTELVNTIVSKDRDLLERVEL